MDARGEEAPSDLLSDTGSGTTADVVPRPPLAADSNTAPPTLDEAKARRRRQKIREFRKYLVETHVIDALVTRMSTTQSWILLTETRAHLYVRLPKTDRGIVCSQRRLGSVFRTTQHWRRCTVPGVERTSGMTAQAVCGQSHSTAGRRPDVATEFILVDGSTPSLTSESMGPLFRPVRVEKSARTTFDSHGRRPRKRYSCFLSGSTFREGHLTTRSVACTTK